MEEDTEITILGSFPKNNREAVCAGVNRWRGEDYFFLRVFVPSLSSEDLVPTKEGVNLLHDQFIEFYDGILKLGEVMGGDQVVKSIEKDLNQQVRIGYNLYKDIPLVYIRIFRRYNAGSEFSATKQGISIRSVQYPLLLEAVTKIKDYLDSLSK